MNIRHAFFKALELIRDGDAIGLRQFTSHVESWRGKWVNDATVEKYMRICNSGDWDCYGIYRFQNVRDGVYVVRRKEPAPAQQQYVPTITYIPGKKGLNAPNESLF